MVQAEPVGMVVVPDHGQPMVPAVVASSSHVLRVSAVLVRVAVGLVVVRRVRGPVVAARLRIEVVGEPPRSP